MMANLTEKQQTILSSVSSAEQKRMTHRWERIQQLVDQFGEPTTLDQLADVIIKLIDHKLADQNIRVVGFAWNMQFSQAVSNSHSSPVFGVGNFMRSDDLPKSYAGYVGRIWFRYSARPTGFSSDYHGNTKAHTGTGGSGSYNGPWTDVSTAYYQKFGIRRSKSQPELATYSYDYRFYLEDWPLLEQAILKEIEQDRVIAALTNRPPGAKCLKHIFEWTAPDVAKADKEFIKQCQAELTTT